MDLDYFKWIINEFGKHTNNLMIELCGGEPGLCTNLDLAVQFLKDHKSVKYIQIMSNGLVRKNNIDIIKEVDFYNEHIIKDIIGTDIVKLHDMDLVDLPNAKNVIVMTPETTNSLLNNMDHFKYLFNDKHWFKLFVERTMRMTHKSELIKFYKESGVSNYYLDKLNKDLHRLSQVACGRNPFLPCINLDTEEIIHCAYFNFKDMSRELVTSDNIKKMVEGKLYNEIPTYCQYCYLYHSDYRFSMKFNKSNRQI